MVFGEDDQWFAFQADFRTLEEGGAELVFVGPGDGVEAERAEDIPG